MAEFVLRYADPRGQMHEQVADAPSERDARERLAAQGYLVYSVRAKDFSARLSGGTGRKKTVNLEKFLIFNQQFVTLVRAGLPILKGLDLLADRLTDEKLGRYVKAVRDEVKTGTGLSEAFANQGVFPPIYVTSVLAGEKSGSLTEVLDRYISYQRLTLALRKKLLVSLLYPSVLIVLVIALITFLVTYVVPNFADLYRSMDAKLPAATMLLIAVGTTARSYVLIGLGALVCAMVGLFSGPSAKARRRRSTPGKKICPYLAKCGPSIRWRNSPVCSALCWSAAYHWCRRSKPQAGHSEPCF